MCVRICDSYSPCLALSAGVPQGSHLGPLLFNLCINSLPDVPTSSDLTLFADDSNMICVSEPRTADSVHLRALESDLRVCVEWSKKTSAVFNSSKCIHLPFCKPHASVDSDRVVRMEDVVLSQPATHRHLGLLLSPSLSFSAHILSITKKFRARVFLLRYMSSYLPHTTISLLYKCYVRPTLEYAVPMWTYSLSSSESSTLDKLQAAVARVYLRRKTKNPVDWSTSKHDLNVLCLWESLEWRRQILTLVYFHHVYYSYPNLLSHHRFKKSHSPRHPTSILLPRAGSYLVKSPLFLMCLAWNKLPESVRSLVSPVKFNVAVRKLYAEYRYVLRGIPEFSS